MLISDREWRVLAGGTDLYPATETPFLPGAVLDINALDELRCIEELDEYWRICARTTWSEIIAANLPRSFDALKLAALEVGSVQIQNVATIGGNLCNASPAADGVPALLILDGEVELQSSTATRCVPLQDFIRGNRLTARRSDELVTAVLCPKTRCHGNSHFLKLGARKYLVISIAMVAARVVLSDGVVADVALAVGSCSATARRLERAERKLLGQPISARTLTADDVWPDLSPIDDVRASASYRRHAALELLHRSIGRCADSDSASLVAFDGGV